MSVHPDRAMTVQECDDLVAEMVPVARVLATDIRLAPDMFTARLAEIPADKHLALITALAAMVPLGRTAGDLLSWMQGSRL